MDILIIGHGAIARAVAAALPAPWRIACVLCRPGRATAARAAMGPVATVTEVADLACRIDLAVEVAGHGALALHGPAILSRGIDLVAVSAGALADPAVERSLGAAQGGRLQLVSGAIGALDALSAAARGGLSHVTYRGRKPPAGWAGSPAAGVLDLDNLRAPAVHFTGTARAAALAYPKNANVAASVALAGIGFERTRVELIADPAIARNIHELSFAGDFGQADFRIAGHGLPGNPKSSALTALSVLDAIARRSVSG